MTRRAYPGRYAQAIFELALETNRLDRWESDLEQIARLTQNNEAVDLLSNPKLNFEEKSGLLTEHLSDVSPQALNLVYLLISRSRLRMAPDVAERYQRLLNRHRGVLQASVTTAVPVDEDTRKNIEKRLADLLGKKVRVKTSVDKDILGGIIARIDDKVLDASTIGRLLVLKKGLEAGRHS